MILSNKLMDDEKKKLLLKALSQDFNLPENIDDALDNESSFFNALRDRLSVVVETLLFSNNEKLMHLLYRVDIPEHRIDQAFELGEGKKVSRRIAELIIERHMQKIDYRNKFFQDN